MDVVYTLYRTGQGRNKWEGVYLRHWDMQSSGIGLYPSCVRIQ